LNRKRNLTKKEKCPIEKEIFYCSKQAVLILEGKRGKMFKYLLFEASSLSKKNGFIVR